jgi:PAS domain S-box-containing protein
VVKRSLENKSGFQEYFGNLPLLAYKVALDGRIVDCNRLAVKSLGYKSRKDLIGKPLVTSIYAPSSRDKARQLFLKWKNTGTLRNEEFQVITKRGKVIDVLLNVNTIYDKKGKPLFSISTQLDISEHKRIEEALRQKEQSIRHQTQLLRETFNSIPDAIFVLGADAPPHAPKILECNEAAYRIFGYGKEEILAKSTDFLHVSQDSLMEFQAQLYRAVAEGHLPFHLVEFRMKRKDGSVFPSEHYVTHLLNEKGERSGWISIVRDITERKRIENELRERDIRFTKYASQVPGMLYQFMKKPDGTYSVPFTTEAIQNIFGCSPQDVHDDFSPIAKVILPEDFDKVVKSIEHSAENLTPWQCEYRVQVPGQPIRWMLGQSIPEKQADGNIIWHGYNADITERKKMEHELRRHSEHLQELVEERTKELSESEKRFREMAELLPDVIFEADEKDNITFLSKAAVETFGYTANEVANGFNALQAVAPEDRARAEEDIRRGMSGEHLRHAEYKGLRKDGTTFPMIVDSARIFRDGKLVGRRGVVIDITERKEMEEKLRKAERYVGIGEAAAMVGHDLRNPLQVIVNRLFLAEKATERLASPYSDVAKNLGLGELFKELGEQVKYMDKIVSDLQDYARPLQVKPVETSIHRLIEDAFSTIDVPSNIKVSTQTAQDIPKLLIDSSLMRRVFTNLITNAVQTMPNGGKLMIKATVSKDAFLISFQDTGEGIPEENIDKIWSPLFTTKPKGTGLGLPTCKRLVEAQNGTIMVESKTGQGSIFTISMPLKKGGA